MINNGPDLSALARDMLKWEAMRRHMDDLEASIKDTVMQIEKTQTVGNVRATYSNGRKSYDYKQAVAAYRDSLEVGLVAKHTETVTITTTDYRAICKEAELDDIPYTEGKPSVSLKLM